MRTPALLLALLLTGGTAVHATTWLVGPARTYTVPSQVAGLVSNGDTVAIDAGTYESDVARWTANNLYLRGVGGYAHLKANGTGFGGKAIWVIAGENARVESIEFSLCAVPDKNGAGIRLEGAGLTVQKCYFHDNQEGILAGDNTGSDILIERCEFANNGAGDGYSHNLYINHVRSLTFRYNYSHGTRTGHELKSRARYNYIVCNRFSNEANGTASREIDLPNGGMAIIAGNEIQQGPAGENSNIIGYGLEGLTNPAPHQLMLVNNTIVNEKNTGTFVHLQQGTELFKAYNNLFVGPGSLLSGLPGILDSAYNISADAGDAGLVDIAGYDYHLLPTAAAINQGSGTVEPSAPVTEYVHPANLGMRPADSHTDIGAHEYEASSGVIITSGNAAVNDLSIAPNPFTGSTLIRTDNDCSGCSLALYDMSGREVWHSPAPSGEVLVLARQSMAGGLYLAVLRRRDGTVAATQTVVAK